MIEQLFGSKTRVKLLHMFYTNPGRSFYVREITRKIDEQINSVRRELSNLLNIGIIRSDTSGNKLFYEVNQDYKHYESLRAIFTGMTSDKDKVVAKEGGSMTERFGRVGAVDMVIFTGVLLREPYTPIDVLVVGDVNKSQLKQLMAEIEAEENKELRYASMSRKDFEYRLDLNDRFLTNVLESKHSIIVGQLPSTLQPAEAETKTE